MEIPRTLEPDLPTPLAFSPATTLTASNGASPAVLGAIRAFRTEGRGAVLDAENGTIRLTILAPDVLRLLILRNGQEEPESWAVVGTDWPEVPFTLRETEDAFLLETSVLSVTVPKVDAGIAVTDGSGHNILSGASISWSGETVRLAWTQPGERRFYGCGENAGPLERRGKPMVMWNFDHYRYGVGDGPLYQSIPFCLGLDGGRAHGLFYDNTFRQTWDLGTPGATEASVTADGGAVDVYVFTSGTPKAVLDRYTALTGRMALPPLWALGYQQSRYSYYPESQLREIAAGFRARRIPCDVLYLDIHYMDAYKCFTWNPSRFPDPRRMLSDLRADGFSMVSILDPGVKVEEGYSVYEELCENGFYVKEPDGSPFIGPVWPGDCLFPDFTDPRCRAWWGDLHKGLLDDGIAGFWNDMNEPAVFETESKTAPLDALHDGDGHPDAHRRYHNIYGLGMARATFEGLRRLRPDARSFVLSRAGFAGSNRYTATWTGDNVASWAHVRVSIPMVLNLGLSGQAFSGPDIGGFVGDPTPEMFARWLQFGALLPFCRVHSARSSHDVIHAEGAHPQEPWSWGEEWERINRESIELRYRLLPYLYTVFEEMTRTGSPVARPLFFEYPDDPLCHEADDEFLVGRDILVAPITGPGATSRAVYLPAGLWYDFRTGEPIEGGRSIAVEAPLDALPLFVRAGAAIPTQPVVQHTGESASQPILWRIYLDLEGARGLLYEDDGHSMEYAGGTFSRTALAAAPDGTVTFSTEGPYKSPRPPAQVEIIGRP